MTYVVVSSGHLRGLHGLGAGPASEDQKRNLLEASTREALAGMKKKLEEFINAEYSLVTLGATGLVCTIPGIGLVFLPGFTNKARVREFLTTARDRIDKDAQFFIACAQDRSIPFEEAERRISEVLKSYAENLDGQMRIGQENSSVFTNFFKAFKDALASLLPKSSDIPFWVYAAGALLGLYYLSNIASAFKRPAQ